MNAPAIVIPRNNDKIEDGTPESDVRPVRIAITQVVAQITNEFRRREEKRENVRHGRTRALAFETAAHRLLDKDTIERIRFEADKIVDQWEAENTEAL